MFLCKLYKRIHLQIITNYIKVHELKYKFSYCHCQVLLQVLLVWAKTYWTFSHISITVPSTSHLILITILYGSYLYIPRCTDEKTESVRTQVTNFMQLLTNYIHIWSHMYGWFIHVFPSGNVGCQNVVLEVHLTSRVSTIYNAFCGIVKQMPLKIQMSLAHGIHSVRI